MINMVGSSVAKTLASSIYLELSLFVCFFVFCVCAYSGKRGSSLQHFFKTI